ncbi:ocellar opsin-like protein [Dinothrombium tinctorium]|uniref:Ocellar opsin-like protein n=1 Tax=Dinothrombium tinctorium TaxID=1965070 RepID=A0A3S3P3J9_9ACAR|nr:ocellar opsin-like protein [Dinothrombium tinctorium]
MDQYNYPTYMANPGAGFSAFWPYRSNATVVDMVPKDMLHMVHPHWYRFPPMNPLWHSLLGVAMIIFGIISVLGNGIVIYLMSSVKYLRTPTNLLVTNLALSDFLMMAYMMPVMAANCFAETWIFGPFMCEFYGMWGSLVGCGSIWSLVFISRDRYNVIVKGVGAAPLTYKKAFLQILFIWIYALAWTLAPFFGWNRYIPEGNMTSCTIDFLSKDFKTASYTIVYAIFVYFVPLSIMIYSYFFIVRAVVKHEKTLRDQARKMNVASLRANSESSKQSAEMRIAKVAMMTVALWFIAWTPYLIIAWTGVFTNGDYLTPLATIWGSVFAKTAACYNPIVYAISHPKYRQALGQKFPSLVCASEPELQSDTKSEMSSNTAYSDSSMDKSDMTSEA